MRLPALYPIVDVRGDGADSCDAALALAEEIASAGVSLLQLRTKHLGAGAMTALAERIVERTGARVIVNDRADVAAASGAAGVHLGDEDLPVAAARSVLEAGGRSGIVGYSTHSVAEVIAAGSLAADYLGFGPVFESPTKAGVRDARGIELLAQACRAVRLPVVAIGGVTLENAPACWNAGAASVAVISEIERSTDRAALVAAYRAAARSAGLSV
ncbi:MAG TPA: thiamine phosphate synthase [Candidatus Binatia bacterium]